MKKLRLCLFFSLVVLSASSQKVYFIYIQTESEQPFFVKINDKLQSSTAAGYIIISKLLDSSYHFSVGFPQNKWPEQNFTVDISKKDHGYLLKNFGEKGWGLFDLQTLAVQMAITTSRAVNGERPKGEPGDVSAFTQILSKAADDPSLKEKPVQPVLAVKKPEAPVQEVIKIEPPVVTEVAKVQIKEPVVVKPAEQVELPVIKKEDTKIDKEAVAVSAVTNTEQPAPKKEDSKIETKEVAAIVPVNEKVQPLVKNEDPITEKKEMVAVTPSVLTAPTAVKQEEPGKMIKEGQPSKPTEEQPAAVKEEGPPSVLEIKSSGTETYKLSKVKRWSESSTTEGFGLVFIDDDEKGNNDTIRLVIPNPKPIVVAIKEEPKEEKKFIETAVMEVPKKEEEKVSVEKPVTAVPVAEKNPIKNNCSEVATESDFLKLRKRMAATETDDEMIMEAKKYYRIKCFSTEQVKNLGALFLTDEGKYNFFDASYKYVVDVQVFNSLKAELKDEYYSSRFKAMLRN